MKNSKVIIEMFCTCLMVLLYCWHYWITSDEGGKIFTAILLHVIPFIFLIIHLVLVLFGLIKKKLLTLIDIFSFIPLFGMIEALSEGLGSMQYKVWLFFLFIIFSLQFFLEFRKQKINTPKN